MAKKKRQKALHATPGDFCTLERKLTTTLCSLLVFLGLTQAFAFENCEEARRAGYSNIPSTSIFYSRSLDRDQDGIACETDGNEEILPYIKVETVKTTIAPYYVAPAAGKVLESAASKRGATSLKQPEYSTLVQVSIVEVKDSSHVTLNENFRIFTAELIGFTVPKAQEEAARVWLTQFLPVNTLVFIERQNPGNNKLYIWVDHQLTNLQLVSVGLAKFDERPGRYTEPFKVAQEEAEERHLGLWKLGP